MSQGGNPIGDVADAVGEVVVDALDEALLGEVGVGDGPTSRANHHRTASGRTDRDGERADRRRPRLGDLRPVDGQVGMHLQRVGAGWCAAARNAGQYTAEAQDPLADDVHTPVRLQPPSSIGDAVGVAELEGAEVVGRASNQT